MSEATVTFYTHPSSRGRIVHWMLEEANAPYEVKLIRFDTAEHKAPEYLALNPMGKLPAIVHRGVVITESPAICAYLADAFPEAKLAPPVDSPERGTYYRWLFFGNGCLEAAIVDKRLERPEVERKGAIGYGCWDDTMRTVEKAVEKGPFLLGEQFTAADVFFGSALAWGAMGGVLQPSKLVGAYMARLMDRPAFQRAQAKNQELAEQLKS